MAHHGGRVRLLQRQLGGVADHRDRRAQFVARAVDEGALALDELAVAFEIVIEGIGDHIQLGAALRAHRDALVAPLRSQCADIARKIHQRAHQPRHRIGAHQHGDGDQGDAGGQHPAGEEVFQCFEVGDVQHQRQAAGMRGVAHHHRALAAGDLQVVVQPGMQAAQRRRHLRAAVHAKQPQGVRILPAIARILRAAVQDAVQFRIEQRPPHAMLGAFVQVLRGAEHRQHHQEGVAEQPDQHAPAQRAMLSHRCTRWQWRRHRRLPARPPGSPAAARCG